MIITGTFILETHGNFIKTRKQFQERFLRIVTLDFMVFCPSSVDLS
jgi:hypothetical protein